MSMFTITIRRLLEVSNAAEILRQAWCRIQVGMLLRHDGGAIERVLEGVNSSGDITLGFEASASEIYPLSEFNLKEWEIAAE